MTQTPKLFQAGVLEKDVERAAGEYLAARGWLVAKIISPTFNGWPDRYCLRNGVTVLIEWKKTKDDKPSAQQLRRHKDIREHGGTVHVFHKDNFEEFKRVMR